MTKDQEKQLSPDQLKLYKGLTRIQRGMCLGVLHGMTQRQAYMRAGGKAKTSKAIDNSASEIMGNPGVKAFMDTMYAPQLAAAKMDRDEALQILADITRGPLVQNRTRIQAVRQMARMEGWEAAQKFDIHGNVTVTEVPMTEAQRAALDKVLEQDV